MSVLRAGPARQLAQAPPLLALVLALTFPSVSMAQLRAVPYVTGLDRPIEFAQDPSNPAVQYVVEQPGVIRAIKDGVLLPTPLLDLRGVVISGGERGLLGLAFPVNYATSGRFYVCYTRRGASSAELGDVVVARYRRSPGDPLQADSASGRSLVWHGLPYIEHGGFENHNGGHLAFGPDGYLYIGLGDGGGGQDPANNAQNPSTLLGKILRVNVGVADSDAEGYDIPPDNPFASGGSIAALPEIWAFGVRNPWKFTFDDVGGGTNALIIGDVGQGDWEEIDYEPASRGGRNYGWRIREGAHANPPFVTQPAAYLPLTDPLYEYDHSIGSSITGGYVYRGTALSRAMTGRYVFADFVRGRVWSIGLAIAAGSGEATASNLIEHTAELGGTPLLGSISAFGRDARGELYIVSYTGTIFRIVDISDPPDIDVVLFNFNGDLFKDVIRYDRRSGDWTILLGTAGGGFAAGPRGGWSTGWQIFLANFNGDGLDDLFLYSPTSGVWVKVINSGTAFSYFSQEWHPGFSITIGDFDADSRSDVFLYDPVTGVWVFCVSVGNGTTGFQYMGGGWRPGFELLPADFDGDGRSDLFLYDPAGGIFCKAITHGLGSFGYSCGGWLPGWRPSIAELNGDGRADVFLYNASTGIFVRATSAGDGTGGFNYSDGGWAPGWRVETADFDGDGLTDLFLYAASGAWVKVINSAGAFTYFSGGWTTWTNRVVDLNGDGKDDVFLHDRGTDVWFKALTTTPGAFTYTTGRFPR